MLAVRRRARVSNASHPWHQGPLWRWQETPLLPREDWRAVARPEQIPFFLRCRCSDAPLFNDRRRQHPGPVAIVSKLRKKLRVALLLRVLEATTYPDLGVIVRALGPIAFGSHGPQMPFDETAIRNRDPPALPVGQVTGLGRRPACANPVRFWWSSRTTLHNLLFKPNLTRTQ